MTVKISPSQQVAALMEVRKFLRRAHSDFRGSGLSKLFSISISRAGGLGSLFMICRPKV